MGFNLNQVKLFFVNLIILLPSFLSAQEYDMSLLNNIADETCDCIEDINLKEDIKKTNVSMENCLQTSMITHINELMSFNIDSPEEGEKMSIEVAKILLRNCPKFVDFSLIVAQEDRYGTLAENYTEGKLITLEEEDLLYVIVNEQGLERKFLFLRPFKNAEQLIRNFENFRGKLVRIGWNALEFYDPKQHMYSVAQEIVSLNFID